MYGDTILYVVLATLVLLPLASLVVTGLALYGLQVTQRTEQTVLVKNESGQYHVTIRNWTPLMYDPVFCLFMDDSFAVESDRSLQTVFARPFMREKHVIPFTVKYRGVYALGLRALEVSDFLGLFKLTRRLKGSIALTVWPSVVDLSEIPWVTGLVSQSLARLEIKDDDYSSVSDIRKYEPEDSMRLIHWKLSYKRNEWMVKRYQTNSLTQITIALDTVKRPLPREESIILEDRMIETALAVIRFYLQKQTPVEFRVGGLRKPGRSMADFEAMYDMASSILFTNGPGDENALVMLDQCLNESTGYINAIVMTAGLDAALHDRIVSANHAGHFVALIYFATDSPDEAADNVYQMLVDTGEPCCQIDYTDAH